MDERHLGQWLDELVSDEPPAVAPWEDLTRARAARRRRRGALLAGTTVLAAATVSGAWLVGPAGVGISWPAAGALGGDVGPVHGDGGLRLPTSHVAPDTGSSGSVPEYVPELISREEALDRCVAGVQDQFPGVAGDPAAAEGDPVYAGDPVELALAPSDMDVAGCSLVPGPLEPTEYPYLPDDTTTAADLRTILDGCSAWLRIDLSSWTVAAAMADGYGGVAATLVSPGEGYAAFCELQPLDASGFTDVRIDNHTSPAALHGTTIEEREAELEGWGVFTANYSPCYRAGTDSCVGESASLTGVLPKGMESATVVVSDGTEHTVPVGVHGTFALRFVSPVGAYAWIRTFDADGNEVGTWPLW